MSETKPDAPAPPLRDDLDKTYMAAYNFVFDKTTLICPPELEKDFLKVVDRERDCGLVCNAAKELDRAGRGGEVLQAIRWHLNVIRDVTPSFWRKRELLIDDFIRRIEATEGRRAAQHAKKKLKSEPLEAPLKDAVENLGTARDLIGMRALKVLSWIEQLDLRCTEPMRRRLPGLMDTAAACLAGHDSGQHRERIDSALLLLHTDSRIRLSPLPTWRVTGLAPKLAAFAELLEKNGHAMEAYDVRQSELQVHPSKLRANYRKKWAKWWKTWIDDKDGAVVRLRSPEEVQARQKPK